MEALCPTSQITDKLTEQEEEILRQMAQGMSNKEIAEKIHLSEGTVHNYVSSIFTKLDLSGHTQAVIDAIQHGLE